MSQDFLAWERDPASCEAKCERFIGNLLRLFAVQVRLRKKFPGIWNSSACKLTKNGTARHTIPGNKTFPVLYNFRLNQLLLDMASHHQHHSTPPFIATFAVGWQNANFLNSCRGQAKPFNRAAIRESRLFSPTRRSACLSITFQLAITKPFLRRDLFFLWPRRLAP
jgi:hypothetical protein